MKSFAGKAALLSLIAATAAFVPAFADEAFGFGSPDSDPATPKEAGDSSALGMTVSGSVWVGSSVFADQLDSTAKLNEIETGDLFSGCLNFSAKGAGADAVVNLIVAPAEDGKSPVTIDEAYVRAYFGKVDLEGGLRKLTWGKADSQGPLDVVNPQKFSDMTVTDTLERKIAQPMLHASWALGSFTRLEGVFIPSFEGHQFDTAGRWTPAKVSELPAAIVASVNPLARNDVAAFLASTNINSLYPKTSALEYSQAGVRLTTTVGSSDIGFQYYYGNLQRPAISITGYEGLPPDLAFRIAYNRYQQIGADYASVLGGFNVRSEVAANITSDISGDDGAVYNPALLWSLGFDRDLFSLVNLNAQCAGSVRLMDSKVGDTISDTEAGTDMTHTTITLIVSKKFFRDVLELKATNLIGIEDSDYWIIPALVWSKNDVSVELTGGIFGGSADGELGQYGKNDYLKASILYEF